MSPLQSELQRLYGWPLLAPACNAVQGAPGVMPAVGVRSVVMALRSPPRWDVLARVWRGVQSELGLPAPAIAVAGSAGLQLWFSFAEPMATAQAFVFVDALRRRFLPDVDAGRVQGGFHQGPQGPLTAGPAQQNASGVSSDVPPVPAELMEPERWSAFVAADLVAVFDDTPWLDVKPSEEGQAALLRGLATTEPSALAQACQRLGLHAVGSSMASDTPCASNAGVNPPPAPVQAFSAVAEEDPRRFLLRVMNDSSVALALRIEAAKALLQALNAAADRRPGS